ncbi:MAG TPA: DUF4440 domain-containing protein [Methylomirabilota bacterium]|jgi:hypothetical protein|nr:DUF4440 domain-containing protein [Methylomirabilota bacterium]
MNRTVALVASLLMLGAPSLTAAGGKEDVGDAEAVLWGARSLTLRDTPATVRDYFKILRTVPPSYKVALGEQRIRVYGDIAINTGTYTFSEIRDGKPITPPARFSFVYRNHGGRWLIVDHHSSAVPAPPQ